MSARLDGDAGAEWRQHWPVVLASSAGMANAAISSFSIGLFIEPLQHEFGWSRAEISSGSLLSSIAVLLLGSSAGFMVDRLGPRRVGIAAVTAMAIGYSLLSLTGPSIWSWRALWVLMAMVVLIIQPMVWTSAITGFFSAGRGLALAAVLCGSSICSMVTPPLAYWMIEHLGWRHAFIGIALCWFVAVMPLVLLFFTSVQDKKRLGRQTVAFVARPGFFSNFRGEVLTGRFMRLALAGFSIAVVVVPVSTTIVPILSSNGLTRAKAAGIASLLGVASIAGRLTIGTLLDRFEGRLIAACVVCLPIAGSLILIGMPGSMLAASAAVVIFGLTMGAELDILAYLTSRYFKPVNFGMMFGTMGGFITLAGGTGPMLLNTVYDATKTYVPALWGILPLCLLSASLFVLLGPYPERETKQD